MNKTLTRWLTCGACVAGSIAVAGEPAATLLPVRAVDPPVERVARAAPPGPNYQFQAPTSVPAPGVPRPQPQPQVQSPPAPPAAQPSLWGGVKAMFETKPGEPSSSNGWWPTAQPSAPAPVPPGMYAGTPAYRWYGYGTPTPGTNPYAPNGRYPQASETWYSQTGATPGAFPVPVGGPPLTPREESVVVHARPQEPPRTMGNSRPTFQIPAVDPREAVPTRAVMAETPRPITRRMPVMPSGAGMPLPIGPSSADDTSEVKWLPASPRVPIASTQDRLPSPNSVTPTSVTGTDWAPSDRPSLKPDARLPEVSVTRGQAPGLEEVDVGEAIRTACFGRASQVGVSRPGPQQLHVVLVVPTDADARDAAAVISRLPEVKAYSMTFEAVIGQ